MTTVAGERVALIVAVDNYDNPSLSKLSAPMADAEALAGVLGDPALGGFTVQTSKNETAADVSGRIEEFLSERKPDDLALIHFSCHGLKDDSGELYLAARNTVPNRLASTAVDTALVHRLMSRSRGRRIVLLLDCCYGGAFERGVVPRGNPTIDVSERFSGKVDGGRGRAVITASTAMEYAFEGAVLTSDAEPKPSVFTSALVEGIRTGAADRDEDGLVSLGELYDFLYEAVREVSPGQTPSKWEYGMQGNVVIARSPRRTVRSTNLPTHLHELIEHHNPGVRRGAVDDLARLAGGDELPLAAAARRALAGLAEDDSRTVSAAAAEVLEATKLRLSAYELAFGEVVRGATSHSLDCDLLGPPLVEAATVTSSSPVLHSSIDGRTITLWLEPDQPGPCTGTVDVTSPAGEARLTFDGSVMAETEAGRTRRAPKTKSRTDEPAVRPRQIADPLSEEARIADPVWARLTICAAVAALAAWLQVLLLPNVWATAPRYSDSVQLRPQQWQVAVLCLCALTFSWWALRGSLTQRFRRLGGMVALVLVVADGIAVASVTVGDYHPGYAKVASSPGNLAAAAWVLMLLAIIAMVVIGILASRRQRIR